MIKVITNKENLAELQNIIQFESCVCVPIFANDVQHPANNELIVIFIFILNDVFILSFNHNEGTNIPISTLSELQPLRMFVPDKKKIMYFVNYDNLIDINSIAYIQNNEILDVTVPQSMLHIQNKFFGVNNINKSVPMMILLEYADQFNDLIQNDLKYDNSNKYSKYLNEVSLPTLQFIEKSGLCVGESKIKQYYGEKALKHIKNNLMYSSYFPYTTTSRPSNSFGGINFAAINKSDGTRDAFISRFGEEGRLILIDFESFHLRLMAMISGYPQPKISFHEYLGKIYYNTDKLTPEQYEEGKKRTFSYLYGNNDSKTTVNIDFFQHIDTHIKLLWKIIKETGKITSPAGHEIILSNVSSPNPALIFNYYIQCLESETTIGLINKLIQLYEGKQSKIILYTYDSILIDFYGSDGIDLLTQTNKILSRDWPTRCYSGITYNSMTKIDKF